VDVPLVKSRIALVDEVIVVNNNAAAGTSEEIAGTGAREIFERRQGYGSALLCGMDNTDAGLIILSEPDGTFSGLDVSKLLAYSNDVPVVLGRGRVASLSGVARIWVCFCAGATGPSPR